MTDSPTTPSTRLRTPPPDEAVLARRLRATSATAPPGAAPPRLPETDVTYVLHDTPVGRLVLAATERGLVACSYADEATVAARLARAVTPRVLRGGSRTDPARRALDAYLAGGAGDLDLPVDPSLAGPFQREVLAALRRVPFGRTTTYGELARQVGRPRAARAVGGALHTNPLCIVLPCHRVVGAGGSLTGYAGGLPVKAWLLALEGGLSPATPG